VKYPLEGILAMTPHRYLRSSPAEALALAIYMGYQHIALYGSELSSNTEYAYQATNYAFWIGFAEGRGIDLDLQCWQSEFNEQRLYGFDGEFDIPKEFYAERVAENEPIWKHNETTLMYTKKKMDDAMLDMKYADVARLSLELEDMAMATGETAGLVAEARRYSERDNPISRQEFEKTAARSQGEYNTKLQETYHAAGKVEYVWNLWKQTGNNVALNQMRIFLKEKLSAAYETGVLRGTIRENIMYMGEYDARLKAAGGVRALGRPAMEKEAING